jgi:hypothetical protein
MVHILLLKQLLLEKWGSPISPASNYKNGIADPIRDEHLNYIDEQSRDYEASKTIPRTTSAATDSSSTTTSTASSSRKNKQRMISEQRKKPPAAYKSESCVQMIATVSQSITPFVQGGATRSSNEKASSGALLSRTDLSIVAKDYLSLGKQRLSVDWKSDGTRNWTKLFRVSVCVLIDSYACCSFLLYMLLQ